eukprot:6372968-Amphidinium_carterae.1
MPRGEVTPVSRPYIQSYAIARSLLCQCDRDINPSRHTRLIRSVVLPFDRVSGSVDDKLSLQDVWGDPICDCMSRLESPQSADAKRSEL